MALLETIGFGLTAFNFLQQVPRSVAAARLHRHLWKQDKGAGHRHGTRFSRTVDAVDEGITYIRSVVLPRWLGPLETRISYFQLRQLFAIHKKLVALCRARIGDYDQYHRRRQRSWALRFIYFMGDFLSPPGVEHRENRLLDALDDCEMWLNALATTIVFLTTEIMIPDFDAGDMRERDKILQDIRASHAKILRWEGRCSRRSRTELKDAGVKWLEIERAIAMCLGFHSFSSSDVGGSTSSARSDDVEAVNDVNYAYRDVRGRNPARSTMLPPPPRPNPRIHDPPPLPARPGYYRGPTRDQRHDNRQHRRFDSGTTPGGQRAGPQPGPPEASWQDPRDSASNHIPRFQLPIPVRDDPPLAMRNDYPKIRQRYQAPPVSRQSSRGRPYQAEPRTESPRYRTPALEEPYFHTYGPSHAAGSYRRSGPSRRPDPIQPGRYPPLAQLRASRSREQSLDSAIDMDRHPSPSRARSSSVPRGRRRIRSPEPTAYKGASIPRSPIRPAPPRVSHNRPPSNAPSRDSGFVSRGSSQIPSPALHSSAAYWREREGYDGGHLRDSAAGAGGRSSRRSSRSRSDSGRQRDTNSRHQQDPGVTRLRKHPPNTTDNPGRYPEQHHRQPRQRLRKPRNGSRSEASSSSRKRPRYRDS